MTSGNNYVNFISIILEDDQNTTYHVDPITNLDGIALNNIGYFFDDTCDNKTLYLAGYIDEVKLVDIKTTLKNEKFCPNFSMCLITNIMNVHIIDTEINKCQISVCPQTFKRLFNIIIYFCKLHNISTRNIFKSDDRISCWYYDASDEIITNKCVLEIYKNTDDCCVKIIEFL